MALWLGRRNIKYEIGRDKDDWEPSGGFCYSYQFEMPVDRFEDIFKIKLKPGEVRKIKSITIELEE